MDEKKFNWKYSHWERVYGSFVSWNDIVWHLTVTVPGFLSIVWAVKQETEHVKPLIKGHCF